MRFAKLLSVVVLFMAGGIATVPTAQSDSIQRPAHVELAQNRLVRAVGEHTCQSRGSIGHKCTVRGNTFTDCNQATYRLRREDCCPRTRDGGNSIGFSMRSCSTI
jgi:hypothetical protein